MPIVSNYFPPPLAIYTLSMSEDTVLPHLLPPLLPLPATSADLPTVLVTQNRGLVGHGPETVGFQHATEAGASAWVVSLDEGLDVKISARQCQFDTSEGPAIDE